MLACSGRVIGSGGGRGTYLSMMDLSRSIGLLKRKSENSNTPDRSDRVGGFLTKENGVPFPPSQNYPRPRVNETVHVDAWEDVAPCYKLVTGSTSVVWTHGAMGSMKMRFRRAETD